MPLQFTSHGDAMALELELARLSAEADALRRRLAALEAAAASDASVEPPDPEIAVPTAVPRFWGQVIDFHIPVEDDAIYRWEWLVAQTSSPAYTHDRIVIVIMSAFSGYPLQWTVAGSRSVLVPWPNTLGGEHRVVPAGSWRILQTPVNDKGVNYPEPQWPIGEAEDIDWMYWPINAAQEGVEDRLSLHLQFHNRGGWPGFILKAWVFGTFQEHRQRLFRNTVS